MKKAFALATAMVLTGMYGLPAAETNPKSNNMVWGLMIQLGHNMWGEEPLVGSPATEEEKDKYARDFNRTDEGLWREVTGYAAKKGVNLLLIDLGEGMIYPSHPELAVKGSWSPEKMKAELLSKGYKLYMDSYTNQQFPILDKETLERLRKEIAVTLWEWLDEDHAVVRMATTWSTTEEDLKKLEALL
jgi:hypothetical protein